MTDDVTAAEIESELLGMLSLIVGHTAVRPDESFFDAGAGSLLIVQLYALIEQKMPGRLTLQDLLDHPSVASLAALMRSRLTPEDRERPPIPDSVAF